MRRLYRFVISSPLALLTVACGSTGFNDNGPIDVSEGARSAPPSLSSPDSPLAP